MEKNIELASKFFREQTGPGIFCLNFPPIIIICSVLAWAYSWNPLHPSRHQGAFCLCWGLEHAFSSLWFAPALGDVLDVFRMVRGSLHPPGLFNRQGCHGHLLASF